MIEQQSNMTGGWQMQQRPPLMTQRFEFSSYAETRAFLDLLADLSEQTGYYPDLNFGKTYVSVNIAPRESAFEQDELAFAAETEALAGQARG